MPGARAPPHQLHEDAAERVLEQDSAADLAMAGFPSSWREAELQVCLGPVCDCDRLRLVKDTSGIWVCSLQTSPGTIPALLVARLRTSNLAKEGLRVALSSRRAHEVPQALSQHQFQADERGALHGLRSQTELNGSPCTIVRFDKESRRWLVRLDINSEDNEILVSSSNLLPLWLSDQAEGDSAIEEEAAVKDEMPADAAEGGEVEDAAEAEVVEDEAMEEVPEKEAQQEHPEDAAPQEGEADMEDDTQMESGHDAAETAEAPADGGSAPDKAADSVAHAEEDAAATAATPAAKAEPKGKVKMSHALVVTGFPLWDLQQITQYFARFGELRTILGANKNKGGKRKLLVAYCRKVNAKRSQAHVHGAEIDGHKLNAVFADDSSFAKQQAGKAAAARPKNNS